MEALSFTQDLIHLAETNRWFQAILESMGKWLQIYQAERFNIENSSLYHIGVLKFFIIPNLFTINPKS